MKPARLSGRDGDDARSALSGMPGDHVVLIAGGGRDLGARETVLMGVTGLDEVLASR